MLVLQQKRLKSLNLNQTLDMAPPLPFFATVRQVMQARCWVSRLSPSMYALFVCLFGTDWIYVHYGCIYEQDRFVCLERSCLGPHVYGIWTFYLAEETQMSQQVVIYFSGMSAQEMLCRGSLCLPAEDARPGIYPDV